MQRLCPRCRHAVTFEDSNTLIFCGQCGAPQIRISEELLDQAKANREALESGQPGSTLGSSVELGSVDWQGAIRCAGLAGGVAFLLSLISLKLPPVSLLAFFWVIGAPIITLGIYAGRFRQTRIMPAFGARLGLLTGLAVALGMSIVNTTSLVFQRYVWHNTALLDSRMADFFAQLKANTIQQAGDVSAQQVTQLLDNPEFRAGTLLAGTAMLFLAYLAFCAAGGAFAGLLRSRKSS